MRFIQSLRTVVCTAGAQVEEVEDVRESSEGSGRGGGRFWMGASAGWPEIRTRGVPEVDLLRAPKEMPAKIGSGKAATCGRTECGEAHA